MKKYLILSLLALFSLTVSQAQTQDSYIQTLTKMFEVSGTENVYQTVISQIFGMFKQQYATVDSAVWEELEGEFMQTSMTEIVEMLAPVYKRHLTEADMQTVISFYQTETGKKFASKTPLITQESMQIGQEWGRKIGEEFVKKMEERGY